MTTMARKNRSVWNLNQKEKDVCMLLSRMQSTDNVTFDKCEANDQIIEFAARLLGNEDPIEFAIEMLIGLYGSSTEEYFRNQYRNYLQ